MTDSAKFKAVSWRNGETCAVGVEIVADPHTWSDIVDVNGDVADIAYEFECNYLPGCSPGYVDDYICDDCERLLLKVDWLQIARVYQDSYRQGGK